MKDNNRRKILGNWLYSIYRRTRYLRYLKKVRKERKKQLILDGGYDVENYKANISRQKAIQRKESKARSKQTLLEQRQEQIQHKSAAKEQRKLERRQEKRKKKLEKEELRLSRRQMRHGVRSKGQEEKEQERRRKKQLKIELRDQNNEVKTRLKEKVTRDREAMLQQKEKKKQNALIRKDRIRKIRPYLFKRRIREINRGLRSINGATLFRWIRWIILPGADKSNRDLFLKITINSAALFILAYFILSIIGDFITIYVAQTFEYKTILFSYKIYYNIDADQWTPDAVKILYSIRPLTGLILGSIAIIIFSTMRNDKKVFKLFFLWLFVHGMVMFFGSLLIGTVLNQGFGWVVAYLYYRDTGKMVFSIIAIFALVVTGTAISRSFLISGNAYFNFINRDNRKFLLVSQVLLPIMIGTAINAMMKVPEDFYYTTSEQVMYDIFNLSSVIILAIPILVSFSSFTTVYFDEDPRKTKFQWGYIVLAIALLWGYRYFFMDGIEFIV